MGMKGGSMGMKGGVHGHEGGESKGTGTPQWTQGCLNRLVLTNSTEPGQPGITNRTVP